MINRSNSKRRQIAAAARVDITPVATADIRTASTIRAQLRPEACSGLGPPRRVARELYKPHSLLPAYGGVESKVTIC